MQHREIEPPEPLRDTIKCFWYNSRDVGKEQSSFEVVPDGYAEIIFHFGGPCSIAHDGDVQPLPSPFLMGLLAQPALFYTKARLEIIGIRCYPWTVFDLLGLSSGQSGVRTFEHPIAQLQATLEACIDAGRVDDAIAQVEQYFLEARARMTVDRVLFRAGTAMSRASGNLPVSQVAEAAHATVRTLERKFRQAAGHTVKDVSGLMRFEQVRNHLWFHPDASLAGLAHELGYTDQAHLSREFKRYSGTTPAAFARKARNRKPFISSDLITFVNR